VRGKRRRAERALEDTLRADVARYTPDLREMAGEVDARMPRGAAEVVQIVPTRNIITGEIAEPAPTCPWCGDPLLYAHADGSQVRCGCGLP
jgi:ribosomal protein S27AE